MSSWTKMTRRERDRFTQGFAFALAVTMHNGGSLEAAVAGAASDANLSRAEAERVGLEAYDLAAPRKAGVPLRTKTEERARRKKLHRARLGVGGRKSLTGAAKEAAEIIAEVRGRR